MRMRAPVREENWRSAELNLVKMDSEGGEKKKGSIGHLGSKAHLKCAHDAMQDAGAV